MIIRKFLSAFSYLFLIFFCYFSPKAALVELIRLVFYVIFDYYIVIHTPWALLSGDSFVFNYSILLVRLAYFGSAIFWITNIVSMCFLNYEQRDKIQKIMELKEKNGEILNGSIDAEKQFRNMDVEPDYWSNRRWFAVLNLLLMILIAFVLFGYKLMQVESCRESINRFF